MRLEPYALRLAPFLHYGSTLLLQIISVFLLFLATLVCAYYWFLALYALIFKDKKIQQNLPEDPTHTFAIIVPAHNEEDVIAKTLQSCFDLDYPNDKYKVIVIADNCSDETAKISSKMGATCLERKDEINKGKGFALAWAFERILTDGHDAFIILDADCLMDLHALRVFDKYLSAGDLVLQANNAAANPDVNSMSYAVAVGNLIENELFYAPKSDLGMAVFLRGTGFVLQRDILEDYPWQAHSIAEDMEYGINLINNQILPRFVSEVKVASEFPVQQDQLSVQRIRWAGGNLTFGRKHALKMILQGLANRQWRVADAGWTFLVLSRPLVLLDLCAATIFALLCVWLVPSPISSALLSLALLLGILQGIYFILGIVLLGFNFQRLKLLIRTPFVVVKLMAISVMGLFGAGKSDWVRTPR